MTGEYLEINKLENFKINTDESYPYLFAPEGFWLNNVKTSFDMYISEGNKGYMNKKHLENCINWLVKDEKAIKKINTYKHIYDLEELRNKKLKELETALQYR